VVENATGTATEQDIDYYPYGGVEEDYSTTPVAQNYKFNGKERDAESGLDDFVARYDSSNLGRFMTPDWAEKPTAVPYAHFGNPQSLNLYSYVQNNPTTFGDPDGHGDCPDGSSGSCQQNKQQQWAAEQQASAQAAAAQNQKTVTVTVDQVKAANPYGHAVIKVDGGQKVGLVPNSDKAAAAAAAKEAVAAAAGFPSPTPVPGHVEPLAPNRKIEDTAVLHVTPDQAKAMQGTIDQSIKNLHTYDPGFGNCANFVENVLRSGGVKAPYDMTPGGLVEDLKQQNPQ
jgi:RHS repeat-associated protein